MSVNQVVTSLQEEEEQSEEAGLMTGEMQDISASDGITISLLVYIVT